MRYSIPDIPPNQWVTEARIRCSIGASNKTWLDRHLIWRGCMAAVPFTSDLYVRCHIAPKANGYCGRHRTWAVNDREEENWTQTLPEQDRDALVELILLAEVKRRRFVRLMKSIWQRCGGRGPWTPPHLHMTDEFGGRMIQRAAEIALEGGK